MILPAQIFFLTPHQNSTTRTTKTTTSSESLPPSSHQVHHRPPGSARGARLPSRRSRRSSDRCEEFGPLGQAASCGKGRAIIESRDETTQIGRTYFDMTALHVLDAKKLRCFFPVTRRSEAKHLPGAKGKASKPFRKRFQWCIYPRSPITRSHKTGCLLEGVGVPIHYPLT